MTSKPILFLIIFAICITQSLSRRRRRRRSCSKVDCAVNPWSSWSDCSVKQCGQPGTRERRRTVQLPAMCGGTPCPSLVDVVPCKGDSRVDCQLSSWSSWSACSLLCGGIQTSTRYVVAKEQCGGTPCNSTSSKTRACKVTGCLNQGTLDNGQCSCMAGYSGTCCQHNGTARPCPRGLSGLWPNCIVSIKKDFPFADVPVPAVSYVKDSEPKVNLKCSFNFPSWGNVSFKIQWFVSGRGVAPQTFCENPNESTCNRRHTLLAVSEYGPGDTLRCNIMAKYNSHTDNNWTNPVTSPLFFAGIEIEPAYLNVKQCDVGNVLNRIRLRPTLPIRGGTIKVRFGTPDDTSFLTNQCEIPLNPGDEHKWHNISVQAICDNTNKAFAPSAFTFTVTSTHGPLNRFWFFYELPPVVITKIENPVDMCIATGDPHYTTFDGRYYNFYRPGDFVLYRNKDRHFEVHTRLWHCGRTVTCNCGVAIRELRDVIVLSSCTEDLQYNYGMPMKVLITSSGRLTRGTKILVRQQGGYSEYVVRLASGTVVRIKRYSWGNNVEMEAPKFDVDKTEGMCGNFDGKPDNDFDHGGDNRAYGDADSFGESWRVNPSQSLFYIVPLCNDATCENSELQLSMDRCTCKKIRGAMTVDCNLQIMQFSGMPGSTFADRTNAIQDANRKKRDLIYSDDVIYLYDDEKPGPNVFHNRHKRAVQAGMSLENATEYCRKRILDTTATKVCLELTGVNASSAIQACAADLSLTGDLNWVESAFESLKSSCEFEAVKNVSAYDKDENGNFVPPVQIAQNLCPGDCNSNGNCTNGTCVCNEGFISADCSMRFDEIPRLFRILDKGLCDIRRRPCMRTIVFGEYFVDSENLTCHINEFSVVPGEWVPSNETKPLKGSQTDLFAIECHLPTPPLNVGNYDVKGIPAAGYKIAVSNDKARHSEFLELITFDSLCQECNISHGCFLKRDSCLIGGHCFAKEAPNPKDWCHQCNTSVDQISWTRRIINFPPNITTPNKRYALLGENLQLQLEGEDPESRPFVISLLAGNPSKARLTDKGVLLWKPETLNTEMFYLKATDECNASSTFDMTIEIVTCPCTDKGTCKPDRNHPRGSGMYICECQPGYEGQTCEKEIDECLSSPCIHGNCSDAVNNYSCQCEPGYTGYNCSIEVDECQSSPCIYGNCSDMVNGFTCTCQSGFTGIRCETNIDDCPPSCGNGTCIDLVNNYTCQCNVGFAGQHCKVIIRNCSSDSCFPGVRCIQKTHTISCDPCPTGFTGDGKNCEDIDDCANVTCQNGGTCLDRINNFTCSCQKGYTGDLCETDIDECANITCLNNGTCEDGVNSYSCRCQRGFTGKHCKTDVDDCLSAQCANGATCEDGVNQYSCVCQAGFTGKLCEHDIDDCATLPCKNGTCQDGRNTYTCTCQTGFTGTHCETEVDDCASVQCANGATCEDGFNQYSCVCQTGFTGKLCERELATTVSTEGGTEISSTPEEHLTTKPTTEPGVDERKTVFKLQISIKREWDSSLGDSNSETFKKLSNLLKKEIYMAYSGFPDLKEVKIIGMRPGSIIADFQLIFKKALSTREALDRLLKETKDGKLGSLEVDPDSLQKSKVDEQDEASDEEGKMSIYIIIGICCGVFLLIFFTVCLIRSRHRRQRSHSRRVSDGMPSEHSFSKDEKYELQNRQEDIVRYEEITISPLGAQYEELSTQNKEVHYEKLRDPIEAAYCKEGDISNDADDGQEIGISNEAVLRDEEGVLPNTSAEQ